MPLACARRFVGRRVRHVGRAAERRPTSSRPAPLQLTAHRRAGSTSPHDDDDEQVLNRERVVPPSSATGHAVGACSSLRRAPHVPYWPSRRAPIDVDTPSSAATHRPSPRRLHDPSRRRQQALNGERAVPPWSTAGHTAGAHSSLRRAPRALCWPHRRAPTDVSTPSFVAALCPSPRRLHERSRRRKPNAEPRARRSSLERRRPCCWRVLVASSGAACAALATPPSADRRHHTQLRWLLTAHRRAGFSSQNDDDERAPRAATTSFLDSAPPISSSARRSRSRRTPRRRVSGTAKRRPTPPRQASLLLFVYCRAGSTSQHDDDERALSRERVVPLSSAAGHTVGPRSSLRRAPCAPGWPRRRAPTVVITPSFVAALCPSPRRLHEHSPRRRASAGQRACRSSLERRRSYRWRALVASSGAGCAVLAAPPSADRRHHSQLRCYSPPIAALAPRADTTTASARRAASTSFLNRAPPTSSSARRPRRRAPRAPCWPQRRAPTDATTPGIVAAYRPSPRRLQEFTYRR